MTPTARMSVKVILIIFNFFNTGATICAQMTFTVCRYYDDMHANSEQQN